MGGIIIPSMRYYTFPSQNSHPPTSWEAMRFRWVWPIFWNLIQEDKNLNFFFTVSLSSGCWSEPSVLFLIVCASLSFLEGFHPYPVAVCCPGVDPNAVISNDRVFPSHLCSLGSFWDLQSSCPGGFLLNSHSIILELLFGSILKFLY